MIIAVDGMGGDNAPEEIIKGALKSLEAFEDIQIHIYGDEAAIAPHVQENDRLKIMHCAEKIEPDDEPVRAIRRKKDASMVRMAQAVHDGEADVGVSAGNTGALVAAGLFLVGRMEGIERPALAPTLPTVDGQGFLLLDVGANADSKPIHLKQFAIMGSIYAEKVRGINKPRVGLLNIGSEEGKGNELTKAAYELLAEAPIHFIGNVESRDLLSGAADVVVTDGFTGNMVLKTIEGTALGFFKMLKEVYTASLKTKLSAALVRSELGGLKGKLDYTEYGGAGLFGLQSPIIKAHGSSNANAILNAVRQARTMVQYDVSGTIRETIGKAEME